MFFQLTIFPFLVMITKRTFGCLFKRCSGEPSRSHYARERERERAVARQPVHAWDYCAQSMRLKCLFKLHRDTRRAIWTLISSRVRPLWRNNWTALPLKQVHIELSHAAMPKHANVHRLDPHGGPLSPVMRSGSGGKNQPLIQWTQFSG